MDEYPTLGNLMSVRNAELWPYASGQQARAAAPFQIAPARSGDSHYDPTAWVRESPTYRPWGERWDDFLDGFVAPVVTPLATALPLAIPVAAGLFAQAAESAAQAVSLPYRIQQTYGNDWYAASRDPGMAAEGLNVAGMLTLGALAPRFSGVPGGSPMAPRSANSVASAHRTMYDPPEVSGRRTFAEVYPNGAETDASGRLLVDVDGDPIHPDATIVGLASDRAPARGATAEEIAAVGTRIVGRRPLVLPRDEIEGDSGRFAPEFGENGEYLRRGYIFVADDLDPEQGRRTSGHEVAHAIDLTANPPRNIAAFRAGNWGIRPDDPDGIIEDQLYRIYRDLNNDPMARRQAIYGPADLGYTKAETMAELWGEAIRAYQADRHYINAVAPDVAAAIRSIKHDPFLSRIVHFNAAGVPIPLAPIPDTLHGVTLPGGVPVASLGDLMAMGPTPAMPADRPPLGPAWAAEYHAAHQEPDSPEWAARIAEENAAAERRREEEAQRAREQAIRLGRLIEA